MQDIGRDNFHDNGKADLFSGDDCCLNLSADRFGGGGDAGLCEELFRLRFRGVVRWQGNGCELRCRQARRFGKGATKLSHRFDRDDGSRRVLKHNKTIAFVFADLIT